MLYLRRFHLPVEAAEWSFLANAPESKRTCYSSRYPFGFFSAQENARPDLRTHHHFVRRERQRQDHAFESDRRVAVLAPQGRL